MKYDPQVKLHLERAAVIAFNDIADSVDVTHASLAPIRAELIALRARVVALLNDAWHTDHVA